MEMEHKSSFDSFELQINNEAKDFLRGAAGWGMGLAILGFIGSGLMFLCALMMFAAGSVTDANSRRAFGDMPVGYLGIMYLLMAVLYFIPMLFLIKFSASTRRALDENNTPKLATSFRNLKNHFMSVVLSIIIMIVVFIIFIGVIASTAMAGGMR